LNVPWLFLAADKYGFAYARGGAASPLETRLAIFDR